MNITHQRPDVRAARIIGWIIWAVFLVVLLAYTARTDHSRTVVHSYRNASLAWLHGQPIYLLTSIHGFLYFPASAVLTIPFALLPRMADELVWRAVSLLVLAVATWRLAEVVARGTGEDFFLLSSIAVVLTAAGSAAAGQMNLLLAALMALTAADLIEERWWRATFWLGLGLALKPQMAVILLLAGGLYRPMRWRALLAAMGAFALPFLAQRPDYVASQYRLFWDKTMLSANPTEAGARFNDLFGLFSSVGLNVPELWQWVVRIVVAPLTLVACLMARRRQDRVRLSLLALGYAGAYLMLCNPRTEGGSYVIPAIPLGIYAAWALAYAKRPLAGWGLMAISVGWALSFEISRGLRSLGVHYLGLARSDPAVYWFSPLLAILFAGYLVYVGATSAGPRDLAGSVERQPS